MSKLRLELVFKPNNLFTAVGSDIYVLPYNSYLRILNSVQLIKVNTSNKDLLKIGQSFYIYFYFTGQYLSYDSLRQCLKLTKIQSERTQFKILTDKFDWNSRGDIQIGMHFKYRIMLAQENSRVITNLNGKAVASIQQDQKSLVSFQQSIYVQDCLSYPIKLTSLQNNLTLCYKNTKTFVQKKPSICQYMISIQKKPGSQLYAIRHLDSNSYLVKSGKEFLFMKDAPNQLKYCLKITYYDSQQTYLVLQTIDRQYLKFNKQTNKCECSSNLLQNMIVKQLCTQQSIKNILISAWLKAQLPLPPDQSSISFIFDECQTVLQSFRQVFKQNVVEGLISQGLFRDLQYISSKYLWVFIGPRICTIIKLMLEIKKSWVVHLFQAPNLYQKLMSEQQIIKIVSKIRVYQQQIANPHKALKDVQRLIFKQQQISETTLQTLLIVSPLIYSFSVDQQHKQIKQFVQFACSKIVPQIKKQSISSFFIIGIKMIKTNTTPAFFTQVLNFLSLALLQNQNLCLEDKLALLQVFQNQTGPYVYLCSQDQTIRSIAHQKKNQKTVALYIQDVLPKNCMFQTYENKLISVSLVTFHLKVNQILQLSDCKQYTKYLIESITSYNYEQQPKIYLKNALKSFYDLINRVLILACDRSYQFDSVTPLISQRVEKSKHQIEGFINQQVLNLPLVWSLFQKQKAVEQDQQSIFILMLKITQTVICPQKHFAHLFQIIKLNEELSPYLIKAISLFLRRQYQFDPIRTSAKLTEMLKQMQQQEYLIIATLISQNNLYEKICFKSEPFYKVINTFATVKIVQSKILDGQKILKVLTRKRNNWMYTDHQFNFLRNLLAIIGGVVTMQIYQCYNKYICGVQPEKWTLQFFRLCRNFFLMSPISLRRKFVVSYHSQLQSANQGLKLQKLFVLKGPDFIVSYMKLLLAFSDFHSSKQLIYEIMGDQTLFNLLFEFSSNIQLRIKIIELMIKTRKRFNQFEAMSTSPVNSLWLKKGNNFIRQKLGAQNSTKSDASQLVYLKDYTCALLDFLQMRQQIRIHTQISQDEALVVQGTNKIFAFKLAELIGYTIKNDKIQRNILDKIQWFENQYKIGIDTVQLTQISVQLQKQEIKNENFEYNYMLIMQPQIQKSVKNILTKINIQIFVVTLIKITLSLSFQTNLQQQNLQNVLHYLHYIVSYKPYSYTQKDLQLLFLAMRQLIINKKLNLVALIQNSIRKAILNNGHLQTKNQVLIQQNIFKYKIQTFQFIHQCINNYTAFSPIYQSTLNYFNMNGQKSICWTVSCYISTLRFLITLTKSLQIKFKQIFSQNHTTSKQIIGSLIEVNKQHIAQLFKGTSDAKLTIIAYQIQLINNLILGPVEANIQAALKFKYEQIIQLIKLPDMHDNPARLTTFKIIVHIKKLVADAILILAPFKKFNKQQVKLIQQGLITYYKSTANLVNDDLSIVVSKYKKQHKNQIQVMNFDLSLNLFFCLIRIYQKDGNNKIKQLRTDTLRKIKLTKSYNKKFKMFYQIYRIIVQLISWIGKCIIRCCKKTANQIDEVVGLFGQNQVTHQQNLNIVFAFFVKNVSSVQIQVGQQIQIVHFLLMKETKYYNNSIRKQLHRNVGLGDRQFRLSKFMKQTNHVILRLQIQMNIRTTTEKYKPIQIIIKNRQLWKSLNFLCACLLNLVFLDQQNILNDQVPLYFLRACSYVFCIFLFMIYFIQNLPLKKKLAKQMSQNGKKNKIKSCLTLFNDKTLWFASIYFIVISVSIYQTGFVAVLMIDFFVRFKISKKVTEIVTRPIVALVLIVLVSVQISFIFTYYQFFIGQKLNCPNVASCVQQTYFQYLGLFKNSVSSDNYQSLQYRNITQFVATFISTMINNSLIIGVLLYQKKAKDTKNRIWQQKVKQRCFICDTQRNIIDRSRNDNKGFYQHIQEEQNLWSYIYYLIYLKNKQLESMNTIQNMVLKQWKNNKIDWLPKTYRG